MQHLNDEDLARLVDDEPDTGEAAHLVVCERCRMELADLQEQTRLLGAMPELAPPVGGWRRLEARLQAEGLVARRWSAGRGQAAWRAAAAVALFAAGALTGGLARGGATGTPVGVVSAVPAPPATAEEAAAQLRGAEAAYLTALSRYGELSGSARPVDPVNRLAALEGIVLTTRAALEEAPADPVINGYHLAALGQRDALLRQIAPAAEPNQSWY